jgi:hypothetical protein
LPSAPLSTPSPLEVLKTEHASLKNFLKESSEKETKDKRELEEKHAKAMLELTVKLKTSNQRIKTLVSKAEAYKAEAADIYKLIFRKDFTFFGFSIAFVPSHLENGSCMLRVLSP